MFRNFSQNIDPFLGIFSKYRLIFQNFRVNTEKFWKIWQDGPMFRDIFVENGTHVSGFHMKKQPIWAACPHIAYVWKNPPPPYVHIMLEVCSISKRKTSFDYYASGVTSLNRTKNLDSHLEVTQCGPKCLPFFHICPS